MFKIRDIVEITAEADATGMLDFIKGNSYAVSDVRISPTSHVPQVYIYAEGDTKGWYAASHFKLKEDTIVEKKECLFKEGQIVWDIVRGRGVVRRVDTETTRSIGAMPVIVVFDSGEQRDYSYGGVSNISVAPAFMCKRTLFFSEPKIEAATEPLFEPTLKKGDKVVCSDKNVVFSSGSSIMLTVIEEDEKFVKTSEYGLMGKHRWDFYRLGEKINFK